MRKLKLQVQLSVDGFVAGPNGELDWVVWDWDQQLNNYVRGITEPVDTILLGRKLAEGFIPHWSKEYENPATKEDAREMVETPKIVFSKTMKTSPWERTTIENGDFVGAINHLKRQESGDMIVYGGAQFVSSLIRENLIDEFHLLINPAVLGKGLAIFNEVKQQQLQFIQSIAFTCGITLLNYKLK